MKKAAIYTRVSTLHQIDKDSLPLQQSDLIKYCEMLGIEEYEIFEDAGFSGKNVNRPGYQKMMAKMRAGHFSHLLVWKIDRISRNLVDFAQLYEELKELDVTFISRNEQFDTSSAMGGAMLKIILVFAELERNMTSERVTSVMLDRAKQGKWNGANVPLGYHWDEKTKYPVIDQEEAQTIRTIFNVYEAERSTSYLVKYLSDHGMRTKRGGHWTTKTLTDIIRNPFYKGTLRYNYRGSARGKIKDESEWIVIDNNHEAIISPDQWRVCNTIMDNNAKKKGVNLPGSRKTKHVNIFSGLLVCGECKKNYMAGSKEIRSSGPMYSRYVCSTRYHYRLCDAASVTDKTIGNFVINYIRNMIAATASKPETIEDFEKQLLGSEHVTAKNILGLEKMFEIIQSGEGSPYDYAIKEAMSPANRVDHSKEIKKLKQSLDRLEDMHIFGDISRASYLTKKKKIEDRLTLISEEQEPDVIQEELPDMDASSILFLQKKLQDNKEILFTELMDICMYKDIKIFMKTIISSITVKDARITEMTFKNGLINKFRY